jgi:hypothetical protein
MRHPFGFDQPAPVERKTKTIQQQILDDAVVANAIAQHRTPKAAPPRPCPLGVHQAAMRAAKVALQKSAARIPGWAQK